MVVPTNEWMNKPANQPTNQQPSQPASQPQPTNSPASQPASQPTSQPASQPATTNQPANQNVPDGGCFINYRHQKVTGKNSTSFEPWLCFKYKQGKEWLESPNVRWSDLQPHNTGALEVFVASNETPAKAWLEVMQDWNFWICQNQVVGLKTH